MSPGECFTQNLLSYLGMQLPALVMLFETISVTVRYTSQAFENVLDNI